MNGNYAIDATPEATWSDTRTTLTFAIPSLERKRKQAIAKNAILFYRGVPKEKRNRIGYQEIPGSETTSALAQFFIMPEGFRSEWEPALRLREPRCDNLGNLKPL